MMASRGNPQVHVATIGNGTDISGFATLPLPRRPHRHRDSLVPFRQIHRPIFATAFSIHSNTDAWIDAPSGMVRGSASGM